jgi:predicted PurR-regulated permease PerM
LKAVYFLVAIAIVMIFFMVELFSPFLKSIFVSVLLAVATSTATLYLENRLKSRIIASSIMTIGLLLHYFLFQFYIVFFHLQTFLIKLINNID